MAENNFTNTLYYGDNLAILKSLSVDKDFFLHTNGGIDLIYIDPPFNSNRIYNMPYEDMLKEVSDQEKYKAQKEAFNDTWSNIDFRQELEELKGCVDCIQLYNFLHSNERVFSFPQMSYLTMMAHRIYYMHNVLKDTGSFYLHCDDTIGHYLKILLDMVFELKNFRSTIIWQRTSAKKGSQYARRSYGRYTDNIFFYTKSDNYFFSTVKVMQDEKELLKKFNKKDENGRNFMIAPIVLIKAMERNNLIYEYKGYTPKYGWMMNKEKLEQFDKEGRIYWSSNGVPNRKYFLDEYEGKEITNIWNDIPIARGKERLGYPTQKPVELLERIIKASSNEGDIVADFFCGCGTTITAAEKLNRKWLGVDINHLAISMIEDRRIKPIIDTKENNNKYQIIGFPKDMASAEKLAKDDKFKFEQWIVEYVFKGHQTKKTGDKGIDGYIAYNFHNADKKSIKKMLAIMEVKGGNVNISQIRAFKNSIENDFKADFGLFIAFDKYITDGMRKEANDLGFVNTDELDVPTLQFLHLKKMYIITIDDILQDILPQELQLIVNNITY